VVVTAAFDPTVIEYHAAYLYRRAKAFTRGTMVFGAMVGAAVGAYPLTRYSHWPIPHKYGLALVLFGAFAGGLIGYVIGDARADRLRVQAQLVLHQLQLERNTAAIVETLARRAEALPQVPVAPQMAPMPQVAQVPQAPLVAAPQLVEVPQQYAPVQQPMPQPELEPLQIEAPPLSA